tara:strand:- start:614 stop:1027 length:414 start_codon:yes stop_codon:yes gene_type:complete
MSFSKLTDNLVKTLDRYVYGPAWRVLESLTNALDSLDEPAFRALDSFMTTITSEKFVKLVWIPSFLGFIAFFIWAVFTTVQWEKNNPCLEWVETGEQICSTFCHKAGEHAPPICSTSCRPEEECVVRQMADGTIQER